MHNTQIEWLERLWEKGSPLSVPLTDGKLIDVMIAIGRKSAVSFRGSLEDLFKFNEMFTLRIGRDHDWLVDLYNKNYPVKD